MMTKYFCLFSVLYLTALAKPKEAYTPQDVCYSISSHKYKAQCETAIYRGTFDKKVLSLCMSHRNDDYKKTSCMEAVRNKNYKNNELISCAKKINLNKCLKDSGANRTPEQETSESSNSISN